MKPRDPNSYAEAITRIMAACGPPDCADVTGVSPSLIYKWADPSVNRWPGFWHAEQLDRLFVRKGHGPAPILAIYSDRVDREGVPAHSVAHPYDRATKIMEELGDLCGEIRAAHKDASEGGKCYSRNERGKIAAAGRESIHAIEKLIQDMETDFRLVGINDADAK